jgi:putative ABC transport system permease protein
MSRLRLVGRLVARDLRRRPGQAALMLLAITAATATLTLGLVLHGVTSQPYQQTRAATRGPDELAYLGSPLAAPGPRATGSALQKLVRAQAGELARAPGVTGSSGPYPLAGALVRANGLVAGAEAEGRDVAPARVDQPALTAGSWVRPGGVVLERAFAAGLGVGVGDRITLNGRPYTVAGIAVTAANSAYPNLCYYAGGGCFAGPPGNDSPRDIGLLWLTRPDALSLATPTNPVTAYVLNLRLRNPATAQAFANRYDLGDAASEVVPWTGIAAADALLVQDEQQVLSPGAWLAALLAIASVAVLAGGRMTERTRRVGLLKAVGASPGLVTATLMAENLVLALAAAAVGLVAGWLAAPRLTSPGAALVGTPGAPSLTVPIAGLVLAVALAVALGATLVPAIRAARGSTVGALADAPRPPRRRPRLLAMSRGLPVPLLLGLRLVARRPRRAVLGAANVAITMAGVVAVLTFHATAGQKINGGGIGLFAAADHGGLITLPPAWWLAAAVLATLAAVAGLAAVPARVGARRPAAEILQAETA